MNYARFFDFITQFFMTLRKPRTKVQRLDQIRYRIGASEMDQVNVLDRKVVR